MSAVLELLQCPHHWQFATILLEPLVFNTLTDSKSLIQRSGDHVAAALMAFMRCIDDRQQQATGQGFRGEGPVSSASVSSVISVMDLMSVSKYLGRLRRAAAQESLTAWPESLQHAHLGAVIKVRGGLALDYDCQNVLSVY